MLRFCNVERAVSKKGTVSMRVSPGPAFPENSGPRGHGKALATPPTHDKNVMAPYQAATGAYGDAATF